MKTEELQRVEYWKKLFEPRTKKWQQDTLKKLRTSNNPFYSEEDRLSKIKALEELL